MLDTLARLIRRYRSGVDGETCRKRLVHFIETGDYVHEGACIKRDEKGRYVDSVNGYYLSNSAIAERYGVTYQAFESHTALELYMFALKRERLELFNWR